MFQNNTSYRGTFLSYYIDGGGSPPMINVIESQFIDNTATNFGGIIYSTARGDFSFVATFKNCVFEKNAALLGTFNLNILNKYKFNNYIIKITYNIHIYLNSY